MRQPPRAPEQKTQLDGDGNPIEVRRFWLRKLKGTTYAELEGKTLGLPSDRCAPLTPPEKAAVSALGKSTSIEEPFDPCEAVCRLFVRHLNNPDYTPESTGTSQLVRYARLPSHALKSVAN
jgi:hypothetical protein